MLEKNSEKIQNIFPEHFKLFMIFWMQNNFFLKNKFVQLKSKMAASGKKPSETIIHIFSALKIFIWNLFHN